MNYRKPTASDIGKTVEARSDGSEWDSYTLIGIWQAASETRYHVQGGITGYTYVADYCRVPYDCPDPIAELSEAADWLAERGCDEAARVLLAAIRSKVCQYEGCSQPSVAFACGRNGHPEPAMYCQSHMEDVLDEGAPEYTEGCPNCDCQFGVN